MTVTLLWTQVLAVTRLQDTVVTITPDDVTVSKGQLVVLSLWRTLYQHTLILQVIARMKYHSIAIREIDV